jgi:hypothetical protein
LKRGERGYCSGLITGERNGWRLMMTGGSHLSARRRVEAGYRFGGGWNGPRAPFFVGPEGFPGVRFDFYFFFPLFLFLDF